MTDPQPNPRKSLSEISHLFLSDLRESVSGGVRPTRLPPGAPRPVQSGPRHRDEPLPRVTSDDGPAQAEPARTPKQVLALVSAHLNGTQVERARQYAQHLAAGGPRVGLIEMTGPELRLCCFDRCGHEKAEDELPGATDCLESCDVRHATEALAELAWDVDQWVLLVTDPRPAEARQLLASVAHWVLLSTCDHDGVVSCYRSIKGLAGKSRESRPRLSLALLNAASADEARRVHRKIAGVCQQFLDWSLEAEAAVPPAQELVKIQAHTVLVCRLGAGASNHSLWRAVTDFLSQSSAEPAADGAAEGAIDIGELSSRMNLAAEGGHDAETESAEAPEPIDAASLAEPAVQDGHAASPVEPTVQSAGQPLRIAPAVAATPRMGESERIVTGPAPALAVEAPRAEANPHLAAAEIAAVADGEVTELPAGQDGEAAILAAVLMQTSLGLIASPIHPPSAPQAVLAVGRDRRLVVLAVARQGLSELKALGEAYRWTMENRPLLSMALPQFAIDTHAMPALRLLVDRRDLSAEQLQPLLQSGNVIVQTYRKLRWGEKSGLLLEAA